jgi:hypothetical protein
MNFTIYVNKEVAQKIEKLSKSLNRSRNSIVNEALQEWIKHHKSQQWPEHFFDFKPAKDVPDFKALRNELKEPSKDPLK